jgi:alkylation response protein AidB-like acyl-CoA dehydrogenase
MHEVITDELSALVNPVLPKYLNFRAASIYGGTNEVQRNIIAKAVLGL